MIDAMLPVVSARKTMSGLDGTFGVVMVWTTVLGTPGFGATEVLQPSYQGPAGVMSGCSSSLNH